MATWPDANDALNHLGEANVGRASLDALGEAVVVATEMVRARIDTDKLPEDEDDCPATIRIAILNLAKDLFGLRDTRNGTALAAGDMRMTSGQVGRDLDVILWEYRVDPEP
jgi:hypothetical protein